MSDFDYEEAARRYPGLRDDFSEAAEATKDRTDWRRIVRTIFQLVLGVAAFVAAVFVGVPTGGALGVLVGVCVAVTTFMNQPKVANLIRVAVPWLAAETK